MNVVMTAELEGWSEEQARNMSRRLGSGLQQEKGLLCHLSGSINGSYRVVEVWQSQEDWERFFEGTVRPVVESEHLTMPHVEVFPAQNVITPVEPNPGGFIFPSDAPPEPGMPRAADA